MNRSGGGGSGSSSGRGSSSGISSISSSEQLTVDLLVFVLSVFYGAHIQGGSVREDETVWGL